jgi:hypothetical protein
MTGCTLYPLTVELVDDSGVSQTGLVLSAKEMDGTESYALTELGNGWYENQEVPQGVYQLYKYDDSTEQLEFTGIYLNHMPSIYEESGGFRHVLDDRIKRMYKTPHDFAAKGFEYNAEAIQDAIFYANAQGVKTVKLPAGEYLIDTTIELPYEDMILEGDGAVLRWTKIKENSEDPNPYALKISGRGVKVRNVKFDSDTFTVDGILIEAADVRIEHTNVDNFQVLFTFKEGFNVFLDGVTGYVPGPSTSGYYFFKHYTACGNVSISNSETGDQVWFENPSDEGVKIQGVNNFSWNTYSGSGQTTDYGFLDMVQDGTNGYFESYFALPVGFYRINMDSYVRFYPSQNYSNIQFLRGIENQLSVHTIDTTYADFSLSQFHGWHSSSALIEVTDTVANGTIKAYTNQSGPYYRVRITVEKIPQLSQQTSWYQTEAPAP